MAQSDVAGDCDLCAKPMWADEPVAYITAQTAQNWIRRGVLAGAPDRLSVSSRTALPHGQDASPAPPAQQPASTAWIRAERSGEASTTRTITATAAAPVTPPPSSRIGQISK